MITVVGKLLNLLWPTSCSYCFSPINNSGIPYFCSSCWADFAVIQGQACPRCGKPFESDESLTSSPEHICLACRRDLPAYDQAIAVGYFEGSLREAVHQYKYRPCRALGRPLGRWMAANIRMVSDLDMVVPVPLHRSRLRERGFNQALLLAAHMSEVHGLPLSFGNLFRQRQTRPQVELSGVERVRNVAGAFALRQPEVMKDKRIVLVDDVFTTGATLQECAAVLKMAGAMQVTALTLARVV